jgi:hypothetical protein
MLAGRVAEPGSLDVVNYANTSCSRANLPRVRDLRVRDLRFRRPELDSGNQVLAENLSAYRELPTQCRDRRSCPASHEFGCDSVLLPLFVVPADDSRC